MITIKIKDKIPIVQKKHFSSYSAKKKYSIKKDQSAKNLDLDLSSDLLSFFHYLFLFKIEVSS